MIKLSLKKTSSTCAIVFLFGYLPVSAQESVFETPYWTNAPVIESTGTRQYGGCT